MIKMTRLKGPWKEPLTLALGLTAALVLAACGQTDSPAAAPTTAPPGPHGQATASKASTSPVGAAPSTSAGRRVDITVKGKQVTPIPRSVRIKVGETLTVAVTVNHDDLLHAHGFGIAKTIKAGQRFEFTATGARPGIYEVELHHPELRILQISVS